MTTAKKVQEYESAASHKVTWFDRAAGSDEQFEIGWVRTEVGYVEVVLWSWSLLGNDQDLMMRCVIGGRLYERRERRTPSRAVTQRGAQTIAGRWIRRLVAEVQDGGGP